MLYIRKAWGGERGPPMIIDRETFTDLAVNLKLASDGVLETARRLARVNAESEHLVGAIDALMETNQKITAIEQLLRAVLEANRELTQEPQKQ